jgi:hypothetical protein
MSDLFASVAVAIGASDVTSLLVMVTFTLALVLGGAWWRRRRRTEGRRPREIALIKSTKGPRTQS